MIKPILFNTEMVKAILDGRKTVTRRVVKQNLRDGIVFEGICVNGDRDIGGKAIFRTPQFMSFIKPPYQPDDILWVRETWYYESHMHDRNADEPDLPGGLYSRRFVYRASSPGYPVDVGVGEHGWHPSIHMPKEAARIFLRVTDVRAERLCQISSENAEREGFTGHVYPVDFFADAWNKTVKDLDRYGWDANPWVWVVEFERCEKPEGWPR